MMIGYARWEVFSGRRRRRRRRVIVNGPRLLGTGRSVDSWSRTFLGFYEVRVGCRLFFFVDGGSVN